MVCTGPISYCGYDALEADIARLRGALADVPHVEAFVPAVAPTGVGYNAYYKTQEEYIFAVAEALAEEYRAIVDAGFLLQDFPVVANPHPPNRFARDGDARACVVAKNNLVRLQ